MASKSARGTDSVTMLPHIAPKLVHTASQTVACPECRFTLDNRSPPPFFLSPDFRSLLRGNEPLIDLQRDELLNERPTLRLRQQQLGESLDFASQDEEDHIRHLLNDYDRLLHPLRDFPSDVLSDIFFAVCMLDFEIGTPKTDDPSRVMLAPWRIAQVCRRWRREALGRRRLWSTLYLDWTRIRERANFIRQHLERSGYQPTTVVISAKQEVDPENPILQAVLRTSPSWQNLSLTLVRFNHLKPIRGRLDNLEILRVFPHKSQAMWKELFTDFTLNPHLDPFTVLPRLRSLCAQGRVSSLFSLPQAQITTYDELSTETTRNSHLFNGMVNLQYLRLRCFGWDRYFNTPVQLPRLTELSLYALAESGPSPEEPYDYGEIILFLDRLDLPRLTHLSITGFMEDLTQSIARFPTIEHLELDAEGNSYQYIPIGECSSLLQQLPQLRTLYACPGLTLHQDFFDQFSSPTFCPSLQELHIWRQRRVMRNRSWVSPLGDILDAVRSTLSVEIDTPIQEYQKRHGFVFRDHIWEKRTY